MKRCKTGSMRAGVLRWSLAVAAAVLSTASTLRAAAPARPNVLVSLTDDMRWDSMGCAGHPFFKTPCRVLCPRTVPTTSLDKG